MAKRSLQQIEESLRSKFAETSNDDDAWLHDLSDELGDAYHIGGHGKPQQIDIGLGGAGSSSKPRVSLQRAKELGIVKPDPKVWRKASDIPTLTDVIPPKQPKVWRRGEPSTVDKSSVAPEPQTPQEKLIAQAQAAAAAGKPTLAITDPRMSKILDRLFPEKLADLPKQRIEPKLDEEKTSGYSKDDYIGWAKKYAEQYGVPLPMVLHAMHKETGWLNDPEKMRVAKSPAGAQGIMQIMPQYAEKGVYQIKLKDLVDPEKNIAAGVRGLAYYLNKHKTPEKALAAYNAGEGGAANFLKTGDIKFLPKETKKYIQGYKDDVIHQLEKFYPKDKQKVAQVANNVLATVVGAKDARAGDEIPQTPKQKSNEPAVPAAVEQPASAAVEKKSKGFVDRATDFVGQFSKPEVAGSVTATSPLMMPTMVAADLISKKLSGDKKPEPETRQSMSGVVDYSQRPASVPKPAAPRAEPKLNLQRDQAGLVKAKKQLSDFERAFANARAEKGPGGTFTWTDPKTGKKDTYSTLYRGETVPVAKEPAVEPVALPVTQPVDRFKLPAAVPQEPAPSEIKKSLRDFQRRQDIDRLVKQADEPMATPSPKTPDQVKSDELWKDMRGEWDALTPDEQQQRVRDAKLHMHGFDEPAQIPEVKESINTQSHADLHDILRLAGRLK